MLKAILKSFRRCRLPRQQSKKYSTTTQLGSFRCGMRMGEEWRSRPIMVIGAGTMGRGIAYAAALGGYRTVLEDVSAEMLRQGTDYIRMSLEEGGARGKVTAEQQKAALTNLSTAGSVEEGCRAAELIIEAVPEDMELKIEIFTILDKFAKPGAIFASNTSSLSITEMAAVTFRPELCIGMHFFNPVPKMKLLELVRALETREETIQACAEEATGWGKRWSPCGKRQDSSPVALTR